MKKEILDIMENKEDVEIVVRYIFEKFNICKANVLDCPESSC